MPATRVNVVLMNTALNVEGGQQAVQVAGDFEAFEQADEVQGAFDRVVSDHAEQVQMQMPVDAVTAGLGGHQQR